MDVLEANAYSLPPYPLKTFLLVCNLAASRNFTVCDLIVVLDEMAKLFKTRINIHGPTEGTIELQDVPVASWISDKKKRAHASHGDYTELRFDDWRLDEEKKFIDATLHVCWLCRKDPDIEITIVRSCDDDADVIIKRIQF